MASSKPYKLWSGSDFNVYGTGTQDWDLTYADNQKLSWEQQKLAVEDAYINAVQKAIIKVADATGKLDQVALGEKLGTIVLGDWWKGTGILNKFDSFTFNRDSVPRTTSTDSSNKKVIVNVAFSIKAPRLQEILFLEEVVTAPWFEPPEPPEEEPAPAPEEEEPAPAPEEEEPAPAPEEEPPLDPTPVPSEDPSKTKSEVDFTGPTHTVTTKETALRIRATASTKGKVLGRMPKGTKVRVLEEYEGEKCEWTRIEMADPTARDARSNQKLINKFKNSKETLWAHSSYLTKISGIPASLPFTCDYKTDSSADPPKWRTADPNGYSCFYNRKTGEYEALVETKYQSESELGADGLTFDSLRSSVLSVGVEKLLDYYHKQNSPEFVATILGAFKGAYIPTGAEGFYLDKRPGSFMRFKIVFPAKYFNATKPREVDMSRMVEGNSDPHLRSYSFSTHKLQDKIKIVTERMEKYAKEIEESGVEIISLDLKTEAKRLREVQAAFETFITTNGYSLADKGEWLIEVGTVMGFVVDWVLVSPPDMHKDGKNATAFPLSMSLVRTPTPGSPLYNEMYPEGFGFSQVSPISCPRTMAYLWYLDKMVGAIKAEAILDPITGKSNKLTWTNFVTSFTYPVPQIYPEGTSEKCLIKKGPKTTSQWKKESECLSDAANKLAAAQERAKAVEIVGDSIYTDIDHFLARGGCSIDGIFNEILNRYGFGALAELIKNCLLGEGPSLDGQLSCLERALPGLVAAAKASVGVVEGNTSLEEKRAIVHFILDADPEAAIKCLQQEWPPEIPSIEFPDWLSLPDPFGFVLPSIENLILDLLANLFCNLVADLLGKIDCDDLIDAFNAAQALAEDLMTGSTDELAEKLNSDINPLDMNLFFAAVARGMTGREMFNLFSGNGSFDAKNHIRALINNKYKFMYPLLPNVAAIDDVFRTLGDILGPDVLGALEALNVEEGAVCEPSISGLLCDNRGVFESAYSADLSDRLDGNRAKEQAESAKNRLNDLLNKLNDLANDVNSVLPDALKNLPDSANGGPGPSPFSPGCANSIIPEIPALDKMTEDILDAIYTPMKMAFAQDASGWFSSIITKDIRPLEKGDPGFVVYKSDDSEGRAAKFKWNDDRVNSENQNKTRTVLKIAPYFKSNLKKRDNIYSVALLKPEYSAPKDSAAGRSRIIFKADALETLTLKPDSDAIVDAKEIVLRNENMLESLMDAMAEGDESDEIKTRIANRKEKLRKRKKELGDLQRAALEETTEIGDGAAPPKPKFMTDQRKTLFYDFLYNDEVHKFEDRFSVAILPPETAKLGRKVPTLFMPVDYPENVPSVPSVTPSDGWGQNESTPQAEAFANCILSNIVAARMPPEGIYGTESDFFKQLRREHRHAFTDLMRKVAKQVSRSPLFDMEKIDNVELVPDPTGPNGVCAPAEQAEEDLLAFIDIMKEAKDEFADDCEPLGQDQNSTSAFENTARSATVKYLVRVYMLETLLKSVFAFSEFKGQSLLGDRLIIEYINHRLKEDLVRFSPDFYKDVALEAKRMIQKRLDANIELDDLFEVINMDALLNEENPMHRTGEEALKYLAFEQLSDLVTKLEAKIGTKTYDIHKRFTDTPAPGTRKGESTMAGMPITIPKGPGGWIRTMHVAKNQDTKESRIMRTVPLPGDESGVGIRTEIELMWPDLSNVGGTFFLEKYIRIEDKRYYSGLGPNDPLLKEFLKRPGGLQNKNPGPDQPHLSGVVHLQEWKKYIEGVKSKNIPGFEDAKITDYFKPWQYGLRLVWVPKKTVHAGNNMFIGETSWSAVQQEGEDRVKANVEEAKGFANIDVTEGNVVFGMLDELTGDGGSEPTADNRTALEKAAYSDYELTVAAEETSKREKAFFLRETYDIDEVLTQALGGLIQQGKTFSKVGQYSLFPLITFEMPYERRNGNAYTLISHADQISVKSVKDNDYDESHQRPLQKLRRKIIESPEYKFLFEYVFPLPRMLSLITIYNGNSISLTQPEVDTAFDRTKEELRLLFYTLSPDEKQDWWTRQDDKSAQEGGAAGVHLAQSNNAGTKGPSPNLAKMAAATVPILVRGMAEFMDPHYALVSRLVDAGWGGGKNWGKVFPLWPVNFFFGWGPPLTPLGMAAYSMPALPADKKKKKEAENKKKQDEAAASGDASNVADNCEEEE